MNQARSWAPHLVAKSSLPHAAQTVRPGPVREGRTAERHRRVQSYLFGRASPGLLAPALPVPVFTFHSATLARARAPGAAPRRGTWPMAHFEPTQHEANH